MKTLLYSALLCACAGVASASTVQIDYALNLGSGTLNGNNVTSIAIFEERAGVVNLSFPYTVPGSGEFVLSHSAPFDPAMSLIVGLDAPSTNGGDDKTHVVFFTDDAFAQSAAGVQFSTVFDGVRHSDFINRLLQAEGGDQVQVDWLKDFFAGVGHSAAFATGSAPTAIEFSSGTVLAPEPSSIGLAGLGLGAAFVARRRALRQPPQANARG